MHKLRRLIANILSGKYNSKLIISVRIHLSSTRNSELYRYFGFPLVKLIYNRADRIIAVSKGVELDLIENFGIRETLVTTISNGCNVTRIQELAEEELTIDEKKLFAGPNVIVTMGRLEYQKGQWHLIRALAALRDAGIEFTLLILGQGSKQAYLEKLIEDYDLQDRIKLMGFCSNPFKIMKNAELYVLPSLYEGMGNSLIEALACGLPCISTDHKSGAREILAPESDIRQTATENAEYAKYGILVPVPDGNIYEKGERLTSEERILSESIRRLIESKELRDKYSSLAVIRAEEMNVSNAVNKWIKEIIS